MRKTKQNVVILTGAGISVGGSAAFVMHADIRKDTAMGEPMPITL